jgi:hypothetical protein
MPLESTFASSSDPPIDPVAAWYAVSILSASLSKPVLRMPGSHISRNLDTFAFKGDPLFQGILDSPLSSYVRPLAISGFPGTYFSEMPSDTPPASGVAQDILHFNQTPYEASILQPQTTTAPLNAFSDEVTEAEVWYTDFAQLSGGIFPIHSLVCFTQRFFFQ